MKHTVFLLFFPIIAVIFLMVTGSDIPRKRFRQNYKQRIFFRRFGAYPQNKRTAPSRIFDAELTGGGGNDIIKEKDLQKYIGKPIIETDDQHVREWYYANVSDIPNQMNKEFSL